MKMETPATFVSAADIKRQNLGKKRKAHINEWKDRARKTLRDAGKPYVNRRGVLKRGKSPPKEVSGRTVYVQSIYLTLAVTVRGACTERLLLFIQLSLFNGSSHEWVKIKAEKMRIKWMFKACIYFL